MLNDKQQQAATTLEGPLMILASAGAGKEQPCDIIIPTPDGKKRFGDLKVGDFVFDRLGKPTKVIGIFPQGIKDVYELTFSDGRTSLCGKEHLWSYWSVSGSKKRNLVTKPLESLIKDYVKKDNRGHNTYKYFIPINESIELPEKVYKVDPYVFGCFLGDGCTKERILSLSSNDEEIPKEIARILNCNYRKPSKKNYTYIFPHKEENVKTNMFNASILNLQTKNVFSNYTDYICCEAQNKSIPDDYKNGSIQQRMSLLQGLLDTDGSITKNNKYKIRFSNTSKQLIDDIRDICWSLGIVTTVIEDKREEKYTNGICYNLYFKIPNNEKHNFFRLERKKQIALECKNKVQKSRFDQISIRSIKKLDKQAEMMCIKVENSEELYLTSDYIVTHNTTTMVHRICNLIESGVNPRNILAVSFTNKAAFEIKQRVDKMLGEKSLSMTISTFHSLASRILRQDADSIGLNTNFDIAEEKEINGVLLETMNSLNMQKELAEFKLDQFSKPISLAKCHLVYPTDFKNSSLIKSKMKDTLSKIYIRQQKNMLDKNKMDFGDLLLYANKALDIPEIRERYQNQYKYVIVDEYQDSNRGQYALVKKIAENHKNICVIGDPEQRIFSFQGANSNGEKQFMKDFPEYKIIKLEQNYRSTSTIVNASNELIEHNKNRMDKTVWTSNESQTKIGILESYDNNEETENVLKDIKKKMSMNPKLQYKDFAILYRNHSLNFKMTNYFKRQQIPFVVRGNLQNFADLPEIKDVLSYLKIVDNPHDDLNLNYTLRMFPGIGATTVGKLQECANKHKISMYQALEYNVQKQPEYLCGIRIQEFNLLPNALDGIKYLINEDYKNEIGKAGLEGLISFIIDNASCVQRIKNSDTITSQEKYQNIIELQKLIDNYIISQESQGLEPTIKECLATVILDTPVIVEEENGINMSTIHSAKGLEFEYVYLIGCENGIMPSNRSFNNEEDREEDRRLMYVAMTRPKEQLIITKNEYREDTKNAGVRKKVIESKYFSEFNPDFTIEI